MSLHKVLLFKLQVVAYQVKEANLDCNILRLSFCSLVHGIKDHWTKQPAWFPITSVQFSRSVVSNSLQPHGLQHARIPCPSPTPRACSNSCLLSWWCHPAISSSVVPLSSCLWSFPASGSFPMSQFFTSGSQSIGVSASISVLPMNIQDWFPLGWTDWISLQSMGLSRVFSKSINSLVLSFLYSPTLTSIYDYLKNHSFD